MMRVLFGSCLLFGLLPVPLHSQSGRCGDTASPLVLSDGESVGSVKLCNDNAKIYITFTLQAPEARFGRIAAWVGPDWTLVPQDDRGPVAEQFRQAAGGVESDARELSEYTLGIPFSSINLPHGAPICGAAFSFLAHAEVRMPNSEGGTVTESAWGGGILVDNGLHSFYRGLYSIACDFRPPGVKETQTAYAQSAGTVIQVREPGIYVYPLRTGSGQEVGSVRIMWTGTDTMVTYVAKPAFLLEEVRLFAADRRPVQVKPGRFGRVASFDPGNDAYTFAAIALEDRDGDGLWFLSQATVSPVGR